MTVPYLRVPASRYETPTWVDLTDADVRARLTPAAVRSLVPLVTAWGLSVEQIGALLGGVAASTWHSWKTSPPAELPVDRLTRVSLLLGIYSALHNLFAGELADEWVTLANTNPLFDGRAPLEVLITGGIPAMVEVRALLDARRGGL